MTTPFHSKYWAHELTLRGATGSIESLSRSIANAKVDLNPHQVDAALFALRSPLSNGVILADEVGLGKTIEAGVVICSYHFASSKRAEIAAMPWDLAVVDEAHRLRNVYKTSSRLAASIKEA